MGNQQRRLEDRLNWLGGIIDGEGMVTVKKRQVGTAWVPCVSITNTDNVIISEVVEIFNLLDLPHYVQRKAYKTSSGRDGIKIEVIFQGFKRCIKALPVIIPFLVGKKKTAEYLLEWCRHRLGSRPRDYTDKDIRLLSLIRKTPLRTLTDCTQRRLIAYDTVGSHAKS